ncbi:phytanoyl-CoA dioxygenase family protein [Telmatospirillum sp.]|uniref:phytanoyl-CoA dioxygenase family protein n=1 Tax=Telmatospirillum sp. TaxID=2079197 RepID=UPI00284E20D3|nr:phytanoyl-CoA dioxygenase family protein [Telmatospirillum sp.]MDR3435093.1 phytanoyl-CoA dioxygenase family protein [Telmatospirillum sp.]
MTRDTLTHFDQTGWAVAPGFFSAAEVAEMSGWIDELLARPEVPGTLWVYHQPSLLDPSRQLVQRIENFCPHHTGFDALAHQSRLQTAAGQMLRGSVFLFKEKINFKESGGAGFELHQDQQAGWSRYAPLFVTAMVCVDAATIDNGCLEMPGASPRFDRLIGEEWRPVNDGEATGLTMLPVPTQPGDAVFFDSYVPHASKANMSSGQRRVLFFTYNSQVHGDQRAAYHADKHASFPPDIERVPGAEYRFKV